MPSYKSQSAPVLGAVDKNTDLFVPVLLQERRDPGATISKHEADVREVPQALHRRHHQGALRVAVDRHDRQRRLVEEAGHQLRREPVGRARLDHDVDAGQAHGADQGEGLTVQDAHRLVLQGQAAPHEPRQEPLGRGQQVVKI
eukprot:CAMPEP_0179296082 /NCGR_PEP_ID=MMETSP0797-20121207/44754_1 /TAXON_ID=47934 /ORGANISM="Dinophysis acuminata, Strain DAEP01" /LENGTH=142 /DNA_ID=CAMNT_0021005347 /DNA_START=262 /DNA_END=691 /DNA_ORIENTATION=+